MSSPRKGGQGCQRVVSRNDSPGWEQSWFPQLPGRGGFQRIFPRCSRAPGTAGRHVLVAHGCGRAATGSRSRTHPVTHQTLKARFAQLLRISTLTSRQLCRFTPVTDLAPAALFFFFWGWFFFCLFVCSFACGKICEQIKISLTFLACLMTPPFID